MFHHSVLTGQRLRSGEVAPVCGQLGGLFKVYSGCRSSCQNLLGSICLSLLLRLWVSGQGASLLVHHIRRRVAAVGLAGVFPPGAECGRSAL